MSKAKAQTLILEYIKMRRLTQITVEEVVFTLNIAPSVVYQVFHLLNLKGILSKKHHQFVGSKHRYNLDTLEESAWASNYYEVYLDKLIP